MSLHRELDFEPLADPADPDDWRPNSEIAALVNAKIDMAVIAERLAPGDAVPLHRHTIDEVVVHLAGVVQMRMRDETYDLRPADVVFIPAGAAHAMRNAGKETAEFRAVYPSARLDIEYLERNPAPGTESDPPQPPFAIDLRARG